MRIDVSYQVIELIMAEAAAAHPHECCGILFGEGRTITSAAAVRNVHPTPATHFEIDPQALIDAHRSARSGGLQVAGYYHSHPTGGCDPSQTDRVMAAHDGRVWAIAAGSDLRFWLDDAEGFRALSYQALRD